MSMREPAQPSRSNRALNLLGFPFESLVVRDLRIYARVKRGEVRQFLDNKGREVDAIVETPDGWGAFEVKLGIQAIPITSLGP